MIVIIDNHDSFTYNLVHYLEQLDQQIAVFQNEKITAQEVKDLSPALIVLSPGPGRPAEIGATKEILQSLSGSIPILGVCLGHQAIVEFFGGRIVKGEQPMHGKLSTVQHNGQGLFAGIVSPVKVTRYHSLVADDAAMPDCLEVTARTEDGAVMGVRHTTFPITGIQFHPESILTDGGFQMLENTYAQAKDWLNNKRKEAGTDGTISAV